MRYFLIIVLFASILSACKKDKFTTEPQIKFKKFQPNEGNSLPTSPSPVVIFELTDGDGDIDTDSAKIYIRNTFTDQLDSLLFPSLRGVATKNLKADVQVNIKSVLGGRDPTTTNPKPYLDTIAFEIYVRDRAKNKSNVIIASPFYYTTF